MHVELVRTVTRDGLRLDGALIAARGSAERHGTRPTAALLLHGVGGNFYASSTFEPLLASLPAIGLATLVVNTRGHDTVFGASLGTVRRRLGAAYEVVGDCRQDVAAWVDFLACRGHERITLIGHSLGAVKAVYSQAHERFPAVTAVVAVSPPRLSYAAFMNAPESSLFWESIRTAEKLQQAGQGDELFTANVPFPMLISANAYLDKYGPAEHYNLLNFASELTVPALFVYGSKELASGGVPFAGLPKALGNLRHGDRRTITVIDGADHHYAGVSSDLANVVTDWLCRLEPAQE